MFALFALLVTGLSLAALAGWAYMVITRWHEIRDHYRQSPPDQLTLEPAPVRTRAAGPRSELVAEQVFGNNGPARVPAHDLIGCGNVASGPGPT